MKFRSILLIICLACSSILFAQEKILIITGGHDFEETQFFEMFDSFKDVPYDWLVQPKGNELIESGVTNQYRAIVFYDMYQEISETQKASYIHALDKGQGMVFLHHSLVSYQDWPEFQQIIGGRYLLTKTNNNPKSTYKHDVDINVHLVNKKHPISMGLDDFELLDEVYGNYIVNKNVTPLLTTDHPESTRTIGWCHKYRNARIVYLQSGHDHFAFENPNFRALLRNAINWVDK